MRTLLALLAFAVTAGPAQAQIAMELARESGLRGGRARVCGGEVGSAGDQLLTLTDRHLRRFYKGNDLRDALREMTDYTDIGMARQRDQKDIACGEVAVMVRRSERLLLDAASR